MTETIPVEIQTSGSADRVFRTVVSNVPTELNGNKNKELKKTKKKMHKQN